MTPKGMARRPASKRYCNPDRSGHSQSRKSHKKHKEQHNIDHHKPLRTVLLVLPTKQQQQQQQTIRSVLGCRSQASKSQCNSLHFLDKHRFRLGYVFAYFTYPGRRYLYSHARVYCTRYQFRKREHVNALLLMGEEPTEETAKNKAQCCHS